MGEPTGGWRVAVKYKLLLLAACIGLGILVGRLYGWQGFLTLSIPLLIPLGGFLAQISWWYYRNRSKRRASDDASPGVT